MYGGLAIVDITIPTNPTFVSNYAEADKYARNLSVQGNYTYLVECRYYYADYSLLIIDIENPSAPLLISRIDYDYPIDDIDVQGNYVYLLHENRLSVLDVSNPYNPIFLSSCASSLANLLTVDNNWAYLAYNNGFWLVDITNPWNMSLFSPTGINLNYPFDICYGDGFIYTSGYALQIINVLEAPFAFMAGQFPFPQPSLGGNVGLGLDYSDGTVAIAQDDEGLFLYDVSEPSSISQLGVLDRIGVISDSKISGNIAFVACGDMGLRAVDISNPNEPVEIGVFQAGRLNHVCLLDTIAIVSDDTFGIRIIDITNPEDMIEISNLDLNSDCIYNLSNDSNIVFVSKIKDEAPVSERGLWIVDISDPSTPEIISQTPMSQLEYLAYESGYVYIPVYNTSSCCIRIYDVMNPANPQLIDSIPNLTPRGLAITNHILCVGIQNEGVYFYNVSDPANTQYLSYWGSDFLVAVSAAENFVFTFTDYDTFNVINIANPDSPELTGYYTGINEMFDCELLDEKVYIADGNNYSIYDCSQAMKVNALQSFPPSSFLLHPCSPNPFNSNLAISFLLPAASQVELKIYDICGREIAALGTGHWALGENRVVWNAENLASGIYLVKLSQGENVAVRKAVLIK
jgi:hypothetical protein